MSLNGFVLPEQVNTVFYAKDSQQNGLVWQNSCVQLAEKISAYSEQNWLLFEDDFYTFSIMFFALLLADKNIILAQSANSTRIEEAANNAEITIGQINSEHLPAYNDKQDTQSKLSSLALNAHREITFFTSGSTGEAKPIKKFWYQLANEVAVLDTAWPASGQCVLSTVTHKHIYGLLYKLIWPILSGKDIVEETIGYPEHAEFYFQKFAKISFISSPVYLSKTTDQLSALAINNTSMIFCSGGPLASAVSNEYFNRYKLAITEIYGSTETGGIGWRQQAVNSFWTLFPEHLVKQVDDQTLLLSSPFLVDNEIVKTDDRVKLNGRHFELMGRVDRIIKLREKRVSLDEMEGKLNALPQVIATHCTLLEGARSQLVCVVKFSGVMPENAIERKALIAQFKHHLMDTFEASLLPRKWRFVKKLPYNAQGKLIKRDISELFYE